MTDALIIFVKNLEAGNVKTRLAAAFGATEALNIYKKLLKHTQKLVQPLAVDKHVFYSNFIEDQNWPETYGHHRQHGTNLGMRMAWAFEKVFKTGCTKAVIIGSDCLDLTPEIITEAFQQLSDYDVVIGPAKDGGYYLLGMTQLYKPLFNKIPWSTDAVLHQTLAVCQSLQLRVGFLPTLSDIDEPEDWNAAKWQLA